MNYSVDDFWAFALEKIVDPVTGKEKYKNKVLHQASRFLKKDRKYGIGSRGGGRVVVCENCQAAKYVSDKNQQFCSRHCKNEYQSNCRVGRDVRYINRGYVRRKCPICQQQFKVSISKVKQGFGIFCSHKCASHARGFIPLWYVCNVCNTQFRAISDMESRYCCEECKANKPPSYGDGDYFEAAPQLVDPEDMDEHTINIMLESKMRKMRRSARNVDDVTITMRTRLEMTGDLDKPSKDGYYLSSRDRAYLKMMKEKNS